MTQKYDKVVWQDETTSQQGTLINAERLDQMQTAHHYADGFEEVDEVPTEDPGVDYHKVVYCTADTTFYRWNGEEWTKDIDDDTKALLLAHEADHSNPHVVTKAQVGLGNADNTSDLDKPVSTATQTALDAKVDDSQIKSTWSSPLSNDNIPGEKLVKDALDGKVTANEAITGATKTKITYDSNGLVTAGTDLEASDIPDIGISQVSGLQDALDAKMDDAQIKSSWSSPVSDDNIPSEKLVKDTIDGVASDLATHEADTANPHSVTKAQVGLGNVDNKGTVSSWQGTPDNDHIPTEKLVKDSLDTKADTATTLAGYGITDAVDTTSAQTITGVKTFKDSIVLNFPISTGSGGGGANKEIVVKDNGGTQRANFRAVIQSAQTIIEMTARKFDGSGGQSVSLFVPESGSAYVTAPSRAYNASNTSDVATIGTLDAYTPMVRTSGNQNIGGAKTFTKPIEATMGGWHNTYATSSDVGEITLFAKLKDEAVGKFIDLEFMQSSNTALLYGMLGIANTPSAGGFWFIRKGAVANNPLQADSIVIAKDGNGVQYLGCRRKVTYGSLKARVIKSYNYGSLYDTPSPLIEWLDTAIPIGTGTGYTITEMTE